jgi:phosphoglucosamine mutase
MAEKPELFGTDGVRGAAGRYPLDRETVFQLGRAVGTFLSKPGSSGSPRLLLGEDTRESSAWISRTFAAGLGSCGTEIVYTGVFTTPGIAFLTRKHGFEAGAVVSASHNPYLDNGIKVLGPSGMKLSAAQELQIEHALRELNRAPLPAEEASLKPAEGLVEEYVAHLASRVPDLPAIGKLRIVADCANGAASKIAPKLFEKVGVKADVLYNTPNGRNINLGCGALYPEEMARAAHAAGADLGVAFDGDADRAIFATREGRVSDGDHVLYAAAIHLKKRRKLRGGAVVGTLMTNLGLERALAKRGIGLRRTAVGDKYVLEEMLRTGANLGGEPSGHIIFADLSLAGDGLITLLMILAIMAESGKSFSDLVAGLRQFPQIIRNVRVRVKEPLASFPEVNRAIDDCRRGMGRRGRVVVRYSGTEKLARVMVEGESAEAVEKHAAQISQAIHVVLGVSGEK